MSIGVAQRPFGRQHLSLWAATFLEMKFADSKDLRVFSLEMQIGVLKGLQFKNLLHTSAWQWSTTFYVWAVLVKVMGNLVIYDL